MLKNLIKFIKIYINRVKLDKLILLIFGYRYLKADVEHQKSNMINIIYNIHNSLPETNNGYAIRTHFISKLVQDKEVNIFPVTRVGFPIDLKKIGKFLDNNRYPVVDDISYRRLDKEGYRWGETTISQYVHNYTMMLLEFSKEKDASLIHSASNYLNGLAGVNCAKILGLPSIYEVRGFWETTRASREPSFKDSLTYKMQKKLEIQACKDATSVLALSEIVKEELISRGIDGKKIFTITNGVDTQRLIPVNKDLSLLKKLDVVDKFIVGFIGSVVDYEGLILLVEAAKQIDVKYKDQFRYLIVGDGNDLDNIQLKVKHLNIESLFIFTKRVPYEEVEQYYSIIDIACYPRLDWEVCQIVSPKKPFEAMAYAKPIVSSSVRANSYFLKHEVNGLIHQKESVASIVENILKLYEDKELYDSVSKNAREWVVANRDSKKAKKLIHSIYKETQENFTKQHGG